MNNRCFYYNIYRQVCICLILLHTNLKLYYNLQCLEFLNVKKYFTVLQCIMALFLYNKIPYLSVQLHYRNS